MNKETLLLVFVLLFSACAGAPESGEMTMTGATYKVRRQESYHPSCKPRKSRRELFEALSGILTRHTKPTLKLHLNFERGILTTDLRVNPRGNQPGFRRTQAHLKSLLHTYSDKSDYNIQENNRSLPVGPETDGSSVLVWCRSEDKCVTCETNVGGGCTSRKSSVYEFGIGDDAAREDFARYLNLLIRSYQCE